MATQAGPPCLLRSPAGGESIFTEADGLASLRENVRLPGLEAGADFGRCGAFSLARAGPLAGDLPCVGGSRRIASPEVTVSSR